MKKGREKKHHRVSRDIAESAWPHTRSNGPRVRPKGGGHKSMCLEIQDSNPQQDRGGTRFTRKKKKCHSILGASEQSPHDEEREPPIGLVHDVQTVVQRITLEGVGQIKKRDQRHPMCDCEAASASTKSMLLQQTELCASASSKCFS